MVSTRNRRALQGEEGTASPLRQLSDAPKTRKPRVGKQTTTDASTATSATTAKPTRNKTAVPKKTSKSAKSKAPTTSQEHTDKSASEETAAQGFAPKLRSRRGKVPEKKAIQYSETLFAVPYASVNFDPVTNPNSPFAYTGLVPEFHSSLPAPIPARYEGITGAAQSGTEKLAATNALGSGALPIDCSQRRATGAREQIKQAAQGLACMRPRGPASPGQHRFDKAEAHAEAIPPRGNAQKRCMVWLWEDVPEQFDGARWAAQNQPTIAFVSPHECMHQFLTSLPDKSKQLTTYTVKEETSATNAPNKRKAAEEEETEEHGGTPNKRAKTQGYYAQKRRALNAGYDRKGNLVLPGQECEVDEEEELHQMEIAADRRQDSKSEVAQTTDNIATQGDATLATNAGYEGAANTESLATPDRRWRLSGVMNTVGKFLPFSRRKQSARRSANKAQVTGLPSASPTQTPQQEPSNSTTAPQEETATTMQTVDAEDSDIVMTISPHKSDETPRATSWQPSTSPRNMHSVMELQAAYAEKEAELKKLQREMEDMVSRKVSESLQSVHQFGSVTSNSNSLYSRATDQGSSEQVNSQVAHVEDTSRQGRRRSSPEAIPQPEGVSYGLNEDYIYKDLGTQYAEWYTKTFDEAPPSTTTGRKDRATPYSGEMFKAPESTLAEDGSNVSEMPNVFSTAGTKENDGASYGLDYSLFADSDDDEDYADDTTIPKASANTTSKQVVNTNKAQDPPPTPTPAHATLPKTPSNTSLASIRAQATKYAPKTPSTLRESSQISPAPVLDNSKFKTTVLAETTGNESRKVSFTFSDDSKMDKIRPFLPSNISDYDMKLCTRVMQTLNNLTPADFEAYNFSTIATDGQPTMGLTDMTVAKALARRWNQSDEETARTFLDNVLST